MSTIEVVSLDEPLLDAEQAAALLNVRPSWIRDATRAGRLPCIRVGRHLRYARPRLEQWLARNPGLAGEGMRRRVPATRATTRGA
jgi:excisionase family DNA binding protein